MTKLHNWINAIYNAYLHTRACIRDMYYAHIMLIVTCNAHELYM